MIRSWFTKFSGAVAISAVASTLGLLGSILVLRVLDPAAAGHYTLIISIATFIGIASLFGQPNLINRLYARAAAPYHWPRDLLNTLSLSAALILPCVLLVRLLYPLSIFEIGFVAVFSFLTALVTTSAAMLNSFRHYVWSSLLLRATNALFVIPMGLAALGYFQPGMDGLLIFLLIIAATAGSMGLLGLRLYIPSGLQPIPVEERRETFGMAVLVLTHLVLDPRLIVIAGYRLSPASVAGF